MKRLLTGIVVVLGMVGLVTGVGVAKDTKAKHNHIDAQALTKDKLKKDGTHHIHTQGKHKVHAEVKNGKIAAIHVKHETKGDVPVKKYKSKKKHHASLDIGRGEEQPADTDLGVTYIGYAFIDELGVQHMYWYPYEMILDGETGAIDYVPLT